jgi:hypothetical protein
MIDHAIILRHAQKGRVRSSFIFNLAYRTNFGAKIVLYAIWQKESTQTVLARRALAAVSSQQRGKQSWSTETLAFMGSTRCPREMG